MIVICEKCDTSFNLDESLIKPTGSKVRCSKCKHIFTVHPPEPEDDEALEVLDDAESSVEIESDSGPIGSSDFSDEQTIDETASEAAAPEVDETEAEEPEAAALDDTESDDLDLSDIEKMLEIEEDAEEDMPVEDDVALKGPDDEAGEDLINLSEIEKIFDEEEPGDELAEDKVDEEQDLVFDLDEALEMEAEEEQLSPTSELDLGDLEKMFESDEEELDLLLEEEPLPSSEAETDDTDQMPLTTEEGGELEDLEVEMEGETSALESDGDGEDLDLDMGFLEEDEAPQPITEEEPKELEFDLEDSEEDLLGDSDIEAADSESDMDLKLELEEEPEGAAPEIENTELPGLDASDLGDALELERESEDLLESISEEKEEESGFGAEEEALSEPQDESFQEAVDEKHSDLGEETEVEYPDDAVPDIPDEEEAFSEEDASAQEEDFGGAEDVSEEIYRQAPDNSGGKKVFGGVLAIVAVIVIVLAVLIFLQLRGVVNVPFFDRIELPFIGRLKGPEPPDAGNLKIVVSSEVNARFLEGGQAGKLFIVTGKAKNGYDRPRSFIQMSASLYKRGSALDQTVQAYCGNVISDLELLKMSAKEIQARMDNRSGELNSNVDLKPGAEVPFMIVFSNVPESLEEYTVTVVGSSAGGK